MRVTIITSLVLIGLIGCHEKNTTVHSELEIANKREHLEELKKLSKVSDKTELATFAGGCFWCMETPFEKLDGVISVISGFSGEPEKDPTYKEVSSGKTGHRESVQITFDPTVTSYSELIDIYWQQFNPTDSGGSFYDRGLQYQSAIFYHSEEQQEVALSSKKKINRANIFSSPIVTKIMKYNAFYAAEDYHQDYYKKDPDSYKSYRKGSGRDLFISEHWKVPSKAKYSRPTNEVLKEQLTAIQYNVTVEGGTEPASDNEFNDNKKAGIYVCIISGEPLFSSKDKYDSKSGWPSFAKPIDIRYIKKRIDSTGNNTRVEVRSRFGNSHLGHVFYDGPDPDHLRYCINSAALRFIPMDKMKENGYGDYIWLVK